MATNPDVEGEATAMYIARLLKPLGVKVTRFAQGIAMGADIEGNKLGLGVNLFSMKKTLSEKHDFDYINTEISKNSPFYNDYILKGDYVKMIERIEEEKENLSEEEE